MDRFGHGIELLQDVGIPKAKDGEPLALEELGPSQILVVPFGMLTSVELDNETTLQTTEIGDKGWNRVLPAKFGPSALPGT